MTAIGHGALGVRSNLRPFAELMAESSQARRVLLEFSPGLALGNTLWSVDSGDTYKSPVLRTYDAIIRDIVGCETSAGVGGSIGRLDRVETLDECRDTPSTYYYEIEDAAPTAESWDQAGLTWDGGASDWDTYPPSNLYVHLHDAADPRTVDVTVVALFGFYFSDLGVVHPELGVDKLSADLTDWSTAATERVWDEVGATWDEAGATWDDASGWTVARTAASATISTSGEETGSLDLYDVWPTMVAGRRYRASGTYSTPATNTSGLTVSVRLKPGGTNVMYPDGRTADASGGITLTPTFGETRRYLIDLLVPTYAGDFVGGIRLEGSSGQVGSVTFGAPKVQRIYRFNGYEPRLSDASIPEVEIASTSIFFDKKAVSLGSVSIINGDGIYEPIFGELLLMRKPAKVYVGGSFSSGQEVYKEDFRVAFFGYTTDPVCTDDAFKFPLKDFRGLMQVEVPFRGYSRDEFPNLDQKSDGQRRPILFGRKGPLRPHRIDKTANGYGVYEWVDTERAADGIAGLPAIGVTEETPFLTDVEFAAFADEENANAPLRNDSNGAVRFGGRYRASRDLLSLTYDQYNPQYSQDNQNGRVTITGCPKLSQFDLQGSQYSWTTERGTNTITEHDESARTSGDFRRFFEAGFFGADPDVVFTFDESTKKLTVSKPGGTLTLKITTAPQPHISIWPKVGFSPGADKSGSLSYTSDVALYAEASDLDATIIRGIVDGFQDSASGAYTGTPNAAVERAPDIARFILERFLGVRSSRIAAASFAAARETVAGARALTVYIHKPEAVTSLLAKLEASALADIVFDGEGNVSFRSYSSGVPADALSFVDRDYLSWEIGQHEKNVHKGVRVSYGGWRRFEDEVATIELLDAGAAVKHGREDVKEIATYVRAEEDAAILADQYFSLATANPRVARFSVAGRLVDTQIGDKVRLTRARALDPSGALDEVAFRVQRLRHNYLTGVSQCEAVEDVEFL